MRMLDICSKYVFAGLAATLASLGTAHAGVTVLHAFAGGNDGINPQAGLIADKAGNLYGTTVEGGNGCSGGYTCGTVFELAPDGTETVLHAFTGGNDGYFPQAALIQDKAGNLFGTTDEGGANYGGGTVFKLAPDGTETVLHTFTGGNDGDSPQAGLVEDKAGNLYGTTTIGGAGCGNRYSTGCGTVFEVAPDGTETVLHAFAGGNDGFSPRAGLILDKAGNLYGTTTEGGGAGCEYYGCGTVFKIAPDGTETVLYAFAGGNDGEEPEAGLIEDKAGNFYGTTAMGGGTGCQQIALLGCGTVFKLTPDGTETVLYSFTGKNGDGDLPLAGLIRDKAGNFFGTTTQGGGNGCLAGCGIVFKLAADGTETVLYAFGSGSLGAEPFAGLIEGAHGRLYGTTYKGGKYGYGTVFRLRK